MKENKFQKSEFILYTSPVGDVKLEVFLQDETIWLTQRNMAELFDVSTQNITIHLKNIYENGELEKKSTCKEILQVQKEGKRDVSRNIEYYNLDVIIAVGYRVNSKRATQFRVWATKVLRDYIVKGFVLDDNRLKQGQEIFGKDYFRELLERVRSIRASERRIYLQITDIFKECSIDYDKNAKITKDFYAKIQNKFHYAITGKTAAEIIHFKADKSERNMGLETWKNSPKGRILKSDTSIAKNYLSEQEIKKLERTVSAYFDYIENQIEQRKKMNMRTLSESVNKFLEFNDFVVLSGKGKISSKMAEKKAFTEYDEFNKIQKIDSDFENEIKKIKRRK